MTFAEAYDRAKRRWGPNTHISVTFSRQGDVHSVGSTRAVIGRGASWEEAFAAVDTGRAT